MSTECRSARHASCPGYYMGSHRCGCSCHAVATSEAPAPTGDRLAKLHVESRIPPAHLVGKVPRGNVQLDYLGHAAVTDILLAADPLWTWEPFAVDDHGLPRVSYDAAGKPRGLWIRLTVLGHTRIGVGTCSSTANDPMKELIGDALRNAAMRFGVALSLWAKEEWDDLGVEAGDTKSQGNADNGNRRTEPPADEEKPRTQGQLIAEAAARAGFRPDKGADTDTRKQIDECRRDVLQAATGKRSTKDLTKAQEVKAALDAFNGITAGRLELAYDESGTPVLRVPERTPATT